MKYQSEPHGQALESSLPEPNLTRMQPDLATVFRSAQRHDCDERKLVLTALGIDSDLGFAGEEYILRVDPSQRAHAIHHLWHYGAEQRRAALDATRESRPEPVHARAWLGCIAYCLVLVAVPATVANIDVTAISKAEMIPTAILSGDWWRTITALTLHRDALHLISNMGGGSLFGYFLARYIGNGHAWLLITLGAVMANALEATFKLGHYSSVGASTAVFCALGILAARTWRLRRSMPQRAAKRLAPLIAGGVILTLLGTGDAATNALSHGLGFMIGGVLGAASAATGTQSLMKRFPQWASALGTLFLIAAGWAALLA
jgi:rhomboid protease GluP